MKFKIFTSILNRIYKNEYVCKKFGLNSILFILGFVDKLYSFQWRFRNLKSIIQIRHLVSIDTKQLKATARNITCVRSHTRARISAYNEFSESLTFIRLFLFYHEIVKVCLLYNSNHCYLPARCATAGL